MSNVLPPRYQRNYKSISVEDQAKLAKAAIAIVGCGGLGGSMAEEFSRLGVGKLILIDGDHVEESNLNRQLFATEETLGIKKVEAARKRLQAVNSTTELKLIYDWFDENNAANFFEGADLVCDALDSISRRVTLEKACHSLGLPLVYAGIAGWYGMLGVSFPGDFSVSRLFRHGEKGVEKTLGNPAFTPWVLASLSVVEAVKIIVGREASLRNSWLQVDLLDMEFERFELM
ncbi:MAG: thiazole biosynthesis protein ThiF [Clostridia bacterium]|jgi:molybdopterin/thiamine biosynthesis adenylyltransferase|nr:thiazole biosynthesis protein ThiF [Clostridia bacterium]